MNAFVIGRVIEPEVMNTKKGNVLKFAVLVNRTSTEFSVFEVAGVDEKTGEIKKNALYDRAVLLKDGTLVACIVSPAVDNKNRITYYLRDVTMIDESIRTSLKNAFNPLNVKK